MISERHRPRQGVKSIAENSQSRSARQRNLPDRSALFIVIWLQYFFLFPLTASVGSDGGVVLIENGGKEQVVKSCNRLLKVVKTWK